MATQFGSAYGSGLEFFYNSGLPQRTRRRAGDDEDDKRIIPTQLISPNGLLSLGVTSHEARVRHVRAISYFNSAVRCISLLGMCSFLQPNLSWMAIAPGRTPQLLVVRPGSLTQASFLRCRT